MTEVKPKTVAIVDDDHAVRESLRFFLEVAGHVVETFASAAEFLQSEMRHLACLISDNRMQPISGLELVERMRADGCAIPILLLTASPSPAILARAAELGIERVLEKPADEEEVLTFVNAKTS